MGDTPGWDKPRWTVVCLRICLRRYFKPIGGTKQQLTNTLMDTLGLWSMKRGLRPKYYLCFPIFCWDTRVQKDLNSNNRGGGRPSRLWRLFLLVKPGLLISSVSRSLQYVIKLIKIMNLAPILRTSRVRCDYQCWRTMAPFASWAQVVERLISSYPYSQHETCILIDS